MILVEAGIALFHVFAHSHHKSPFEANTDATLGFTFPFELNER